MSGYRATDPTQCRTAYERMVKDGSLSKCEDEIVHALMLEAAPRTAGELAAAMAHAGPNHANRNNVATRLSEMSRRGIVKSGLTRKCSVSGHKAFPWELTGELAGPKVKRPAGKAAQLEELLLKLSTALGESELKGEGLSAKDCGRWAVRIEQRVETIKTKTMR